MSAPSARSSAGASTQRVAGIRKSRCGVAGSSSVCQSRSVGGRSSAGVGHRRAMLPRVTTVADLSTPALVVDTDALARNLDTMTAALPGARLRPHVKAHKCTALAREQAAPRPHALHVRDAARDRRHGPRRARRRPAARERDASTRTRLRAMADCRRAGHRRGRQRRDRRRGRRRTASAKCSIDVNVCMPRCGCAPDDARRLADRAAPPGSRCAA